MAYIVACYYVNEETTSTSLTVPFQAGHKAGDVLAVFKTQDGGSGTFSAPGGWSPVFGGSQAAQNGQRTWGWWKYAASSSEAAAAFTSSLSENMGAIVFIIRGAHGTNPIEAAAIGASSAQPMVPSGLTTSNDNCLLLYGAGCDNQATRFSATPGDFIMTAVGASGGAACCAGFSYQDTAGSTPTPGIRRFLGAGGSVWAVAIRDDGNNARRAYLASGADVIRLFGGQGAAYDPVDTIAAPSSITGTLGGVTCSATAGTLTNTATSDGSQDQFSLVTMSDTPGTDVWSGATWVFPSTVDLAGKIVSLSWGAVTNTSAPNEYAAVFADSSGDWAAFDLGTQAQIRAFGGTTANPTAFLDVSQFTPMDSSGAIDWADIKKFGIFVFRLASSTTRTVGVRHLMAAGPSTIKLIPGAGHSDFTLAQDIALCLNSGYEDEWALLQGLGQVVVRMPLVFGASGKKMRLSAVASAIEGNRAYTADIPTFYYQVDDFGSKYTINAQSTDTVDFAACLLACEIPTVLEIAATASPSATWNFSGAVLNGVTLHHLAPGVTVNGATILRSSTIDLQGNLAGCTIANAAASPALETADPDNISGCSFTQRAAGGHAIEVTTPGTYTFAGNTFTGYGADGTTDAAIYNNSGGAVTLNITGGGDTPTIRNGSGASTTVNSGATLTLTGLIAGSDIVILDAGTTTERVNVDANAGTTYGYSYTATGDVDIGVFKTGYVPLYVRGFTLTTSDATLPIAQAVDRGYLNP